MAAVDLDGRADARAVASGLISLGLRLEAFPAAARAIAGANITVFRFFTAPALSSWAVTGELTVERISLIANASATASADLTVVKAEDINPPTRPGSGDGSKNKAAAIKSASSAIGAQLSKWRQAQALLADARAELESIRERKLAAELDKGEWESFKSIETRDAWCTTYTKEATGEVATIDIPGESSLILVAPEARAWNPSDGNLVARELQRGDQLFYNAAILPGIQRYRPKYRTGVLTALDVQTNRADVRLDDAVSTAQNLPINLARDLTSIPVQYLSCHAAAFEVGDRVVVEFIGQDPENAIVIGFVDTPKPCTFMYCSRFDGASSYDFQFRTAALFEEFIHSQSISVTIEVENSAGKVVSSVTLVEDPQSPKPVYSQTGGRVRGFYGSIVPTPWISPGSRAFYPPFYAAQEFSVDSGEEMGFGGNLGGGIIPDPASFRIKVIANGKTFLYVRAINEAPGIQTGRVSGPIKIAPGAWGATSIPGPEVIDAMP